MIYDLLSLFSGKVSETNLSTELDIDRLVIYNIMFQSFTNPFAHSLFFMYLFDLCKSTNLFN